MAMDFSGHGELGPYLARHLGLFGLYPREPTFDVAEHSVHNQAFEALSPNFLFAQKACLFEKKAFHTPISTEGRTLPFLQAPPHLSKRTHIMEPSSPFLKGEIYNESLPDLEGEASTVKYRPLSSTPSMEVAPPSKGEICNKSLAELREEASTVKSRPISSTPSIEVVPDTRTSTPFQRPVYRAISRPAKREGVDKSENLDIEHQPTTYEHEPTTYDNLHTLPNDVSVTRTTRAFDRPKGPKKIDTALRKESVKRLKRITGDAIVSDSGSVVRHKVVTRVSCRTRLSTKEPPRTTRLPATQAQWKPKLVAKRALSVLTCWTLEVRSLSQ